MKIGGIVFIFLALATMGLWFAHGADLATREKVPVTIKTVDDFGDETETVEWKAPTEFPLTGFHMGLDFAGPIAGLFMLSGGALIVFARRRERLAQ